MNRACCLVVCAFAAWLGVAFGAFAQEPFPRDRPRVRFEIEREGTDLGDTEQRGGAPGPGWGPPAARSRPWLPRMGQEHPAGPVAATEPIPCGFFVIEGRYVPPPYTVAWRDGALHVNGHRLPEFNEPGSGAGWTQAWRKSPARTVAKIEQRLQDDELLIALDPQIAGFVNAYEAVGIFEILLGDDAPEVKTKALSAIPLAWIHSADWAALVEAFEPTPELRRRVAHLKEELETPVFVGPEAQASSATLASGMTIVSIILTALALGTLLHYRPARNRGWRGLNPTRGACRLVVRCAILLVVLNLFDLACTLLAVQSGGFWEINPLAHRMMGNLTAVAVWKIGLVGVGAAMLVVLRRYRLTQIASWWTCVFYTVLMLRWATYNSMFLT